MINVLIAIQARSTSSRLPNKHMQDLGGRLILDYCLDSCLGASEYFNRTYAQKGVSSRVALLVPTGDNLATVFRSKVDIVEGSELDVLGRYKQASDTYRPDYICRITGDCPLIPQYIIAKIMMIAVKNQYDYVSNVDPAVRTAEDGVDCEVMSRKMLDWLDAKARTDYCREHVTAHATDTMPKWANLGVIVNYFDRSHVKVSVDTLEDLERVRGELAAVSGKLAIAERRYGRRKVHRL